LRRLPGRGRGAARASALPALLARHPRAQQRRPAGGRRPDPAARALRRGRVPGPAAGHGPLRALPDRRALEPGVRQRVRPGGLPLGIPAAAPGVSAPVAQERSYRALLGVPGFPRVVVSSLLTRTAGQMGAIALVLFVLGRYHSPVLAGWVIFLSIFPGTLVSPIAGALLDRHGRKRLIIFDYLIAAVALVLIGVLGLLDRLPAPLL